VLLFNYVWLKANFITEDATVSPMLDNYVIKLGK